MPAMAIPMITAAITRSRWRTNGRTAIHSANAAAPIANTIDAATYQRSYATSIGSVSASMPTKCMLQMPTPIASATPSSHSARARPVLAKMRPARSSAVYDARIAMTTESTTSPVLYDCSTMCGTAHPALRTSQRSRRTRSTARAVTLAPLEIRRLLRGAEKRRPARDLVHVDAEEHRTLRRWISRQECLRHHVAKERQRTKICVGARLGIEQVETSLHHHARPVEDIVDFVDLERTP